jgi:hypothetical protein
MKFEISELKIKPRTYSYVVIWKKRLSSIPPLSTDFLKKLFGDDKLQYNFTQNGLQANIPYKTVQLPNLGVGTPLLTILPQPQVTIGYDSFTYLHTDYEDFLKVYEGLISELKSKYNAFFVNLLPAQIGINIDYEIIYPNTFLNQTFFKDRFIGKSGSDFGFKDELVQEINMQLIEENKSKMIQVKIQPLLTDQHGIYLHTNDHYGITPSQSIFTVEQLKKFSELSIEKLKSQIIPYLNTI